MNSGNFVRKCWMLIFGSWSWRIRYFLGWNSCISNIIFTSKRFWIYWNFGRCWLKGELKSIEFGSGTEIEGDCSWMKGAMGDESSTTFMNLRPWWHGSLLADCWYSWMWWGKWIMPPIVSLPALITLPALTADVVMVRTVLLVITAARMAPATRREGQRGEYGMRSTYRLYKSIDFANNIMLERGTLGCRELSWRGRD